MTKYFGSRPTEDVLQHFQVIADTLSPTLVADVAFDLSVIIDDSEGEGSAVPETIKLETLRNLATYVAGLVLLPRAEEIVIGILEDTEEFLVEFLGEDEDDSNYYDEYEEDNCDCDSCLIAFLEEDQ